MPQTASAPADGARDADGSALALSKEQAAEPLARRPYDLRHACLSQWLNACVPVTQVAESAGHSVRVLMRVYAKCVYGQDEAARLRIEAALDREKTSSDENLTEEL